MQVKILRGVSLKRVHDENFGTMIRYGKAIKEYKRTITKPRNFKSKVFLFIGPPGKGKSTLMKLIGQALGSFYKAPAPKESGAYYDDYDGEDVFMMDEFDGSRMKPTDFNELCDEHEYVLPYTVVLGIRWFLSISLLVRTICRSSGGRIEILTSSVKQRDALMRLQGWF